MRYVVRVYRPVDKEQFIEDCREQEKREIEKALNSMFGEPKQTDSPADTQRHFSTDAVRDSATGKGRYDLLPMNAIDALAKHCERGALHYGDGNADLGIPQKSLIDSAMRHIQKYITGDAEEHHLVAAFWSIGRALEQEITRPELVDLPGRKNDKAGVAW